MAESSGMERIQGRLELLIVMAIGLMIGIGFAFVLVGVHDVKDEVAKARRDILILDNYWTERASE